MLAAMWLHGLSVNGSPAAEPVVDFQRDIRPILSNACFDCHGPDAKARKAKLRLDLPARDALVGGDKAIIVPGRPEQSELMRRITAADAAERMPPAKHTRQLKAGEIELLRRWIVQGAKWQTHWALTPPGRPALPKVAQGAWPRNGIDAFILARLEKEGLRPAAEANRTTLIRRVTLDLTGLPPTPREVDAFLADSAADAYEKLVDRLLASPRYGERMASDWLDAARYADTNGYQVDRDREMWPWRDWVVSAFNRNLPFDQFTIEQLAGDLLAGATRDQRVATGLHRNHLLNEEGGVIPEEFLAEYIADRVETTATVWLGLTMGCARCHDHKYDPLTQKDYYGLYAFFHNVPESGLGNFGAIPKLSAPPLLKLATPEQQKKLDELAAAIAKLDKQLVAPGLELATEQVPQKQLQGDLAKLKKERLALEAEVPTMMVMSELPKARDTFLLIRGEYSKKGAKVGPATPVSLHPFAKEAPANRLGLAQWLVDSANPLTARVTVNRYWQSYFGAGLVRTAEDFGSQGELPSHPELLDWLAANFVKGWDIRALQKMIVMSATYRQASRLTPELLDRDPENRLLARGPRLRLSAEMIRDQALAVSGLLVEKLGGPPVKPYHPSGIYEQVVYQGGKNYEQSKGPDLYRRSLYTYWKRSVPHPAMLTFDAPFRESCTVRRPRTSTPLQALNLMNDPTYVEAARFLAQRMMQEQSGTPQERIAHGFRLAMARSPQPRELNVLSAGFQRMLADFRADRKAADALLKIGEAPANPALDRAELAAFTTVASTLLNLDEAITKE